MKKAIFILTIIGFMSGLVLSCQSPGKKEKEAQEEVIEAQEDLNEAKQDANAAKMEAATEEEWKAYKAETDAKIAANERTIAEMKTKTKKTEKSVDSMYARTINDLERKNKDLKMRLNAYKNDANSDWQSFKRELDHDVDEVDQAVKDITTKVKK